MSGLACLSHFIDEATPLYGGKKGILLEKLTAFSNGDQSNSGYFKFPGHCSTHIDLPSHFIREGKTLSEFEIGTFVFTKIEFVSFSSKPNEIIYPSDSFNNLSPSAELLLIQTHFESMRHESTYWENGPGLSTELSQFLAQHCPKLRAIGIDCISVSSFQNRPLGREAHRVFLGNNQLLIEDMKLSAYKPHPTQIVVAPLLIKDADGVPVTVIEWYS